MSDQELRRRLEDLHRELAGIDRVDAGLEPLLDELKSDIEAVLERSEHPGAEEGAPQGLADRLSEAVERFEAGHPALASAMGAVIDQLARLGI